MDRRRFLALVAAGGVAGCSSGDDTSTDTRSTAEPTASVTPTPSSTETGAPTHTATPTPETAVADDAEAASTPTPTAVSDHQIRILSSGYGGREQEGVDVRYIAARIQNEDEKPLSVTLSGRFRDGDDNLLFTRQVSIAKLDPGEVWETEMSVSNRYTVDIFGGDLEIDSVYPVALDEASNASITGDQWVGMQSSNDTPYVDGTALNEGEDERWLGVYARFYADNRNLIGTGWDSISGLNADESWRFFVDINSPIRFAQDRVASYDLTLVQSQQLLPIETETEEPVA
jgi:hypothetical protein